MARVVVVGGGLGGCASAARLAKLGHDVTLVERLDHVGGAIGFMEEDGYRWDTGPVSTPLPAVIRDLFRKSGRPLERELDLVPVEPIREHRFEDGSVLAMPSGSRAAQHRAIDAALGDGLGDQWLDYTHAFADTWDVLRRNYLERPYSAEHVGKETKDLLTSRNTLHRLVSRTFKDERMRELALAPVVLDGHDPRNVPAWMGMMAYVEQNFGVWTVPGGMGALAAALTKRLGERRVDVRTGYDGQRHRAWRTTTRPAWKPTAGASTPTSWCARSTREGSRSSPTTSARRCRRSPRSWSTSASRATSPTCHMRSSCTAIRCSSYAPTAPRPTEAAPGPCSAGAGWPRTS